VILPGIPAQAVDSSLRSHSFYPVTPRRSLPSDSAARAIKSPDRFHSLCERASDAPVGQHDHRAGDSSYLIASSHLPSLEQHRYRPKPSRVRLERLGVTFAYQHRRQPCELIGLGIADLLQKVCTGGAIRIRKEQHQCSTRQHPVG
jgi:hypothetical protein